MNRKQARVQQKARLGRMLRERREFLGLRQEDLADHGGPNVRTTQLYELGNQGDTTQPKTYNKFEVALQLKPDSLRITAAGGELQPLAGSRQLPPVPPAVESARVRQRADELLQRLSQIVEQAETGAPDPDQTLLLARSARDLANGLFGAAGDLDRELEALQEEVREQNGDPV